MTLTADPLVETGVLAALSVVEAALAMVPTDVPSVSRLSDSDLVAASTRVGRERDALGAVSAVLAGEIARRSAPEFGSRGLAQRNGFRTPIEMVKVTTRATGREASVAVRAGALLVETATEGDAHPVTGEIVSIAEPWLRPVAIALGQGAVSLASVDAIRAGLGAPNSAVSALALAAAASQLVEAAQVADPDEVHRLARAARTELDAAGVAIREAERRDQRALRLVVLPDGMGRLSWTLDPATLAVVKDLYDRATSPKLGGVRFVAPDLQMKRDEILSDARTPHQLASDAFAHLLTAGSDADPSTLIGSGAPVVKIITIAEHSVRGRAVPPTPEPAPTPTPTPAPARRGYREGQHDPVSSGTLDHAICTGTAEAVPFDSNGRPFDPTDGLDHGGGSVLLDEAREHRLFTKRQKAALAARDGGCRWPGCQRPPSWCEAHHIRWWSRHRGSTHVDNGILLCKHHHLLLHNNSWEIQRRSTGDGVSIPLSVLARSADQSASGTDNLWLIPPADIDATRTPRLMPSKSPLWKDLFG